MIKSTPDALLRTHRPIINCNEPKLTDQSQTPMTEINNIMQQYTRNGTFPGLQNNQMQYVDDTQVPTFMNAHEKIVFAKQLFDKLPTALKNELSNDYRKFESWVTDPDNQDRAIKYGLLKKTEYQPSPPKSEPAKPEPEAASAPTI